jgi:pyruvate-formate lyase-activating enzyme
MPADSLFTHEDLGLSPEETRAAIQAEIRQRLETAYQTELLNHPPVRMVNWREVGRDEAERGAKKIAKKDIDRVMAAIACAGLSVVDPAQVSQEEFRRAVR